VGAWLESRFGVMVVFHWSGAVIAAAVAAFPLFLIPARGAIEGVDPALEDVARMLGRREWSVFAGVTLPLAWRGMAAGAILVFVKAMGDFGATMMVAGNIPGRTQTVAAAIYNAVEANEPGRAAWLSVCVSVVSIAALWVVQRSLPARGTGR
jgi:molybdate transport system permease protein